MRFRKEVLYPDTFYGHSPDGERVEVSYSPETISHLANRAKEMMAAGIAIPAAWEHQELAVPMTPEERAAFLEAKTRGVAAWPDKWEEDGGKVWCELDVEDEQAAKDVARIRYVSPAIVQDFMDGTGKVWPGLSITHLAITPRPVQHKQAPFQPVQLGFKTVWLSLGDAMADDKDKPEDDYEDDDLFDDDMEEETTSDVESTETPEMTPEPTPEPVPEDNAWRQDANMVIADMKGLGLDISPQFTDAADFIKHIHTAVKTKLASDGNANDQGITGSDEYTDPNQGVETVPNTATLMSLESKVKALETTIISDGRKTVVERINSLHQKGKIDKDLHADLLKRAQTVQLSLDESGRLAKCGLLETIETLEKNKVRRKLKGGEARLSMGGYDHGVTRVETPGETHQKRPLNREVMNKLTRGAYDQYDKNGTNGKGKE